MITIERLDSEAGDFDQRLRRLLAWDSLADEAVTQAVADIIAQVRQNGDEALLAYTARFDRLQVDSAARLEVGPERLQAAFDAIAPEQQEALRYAADRLIDYHRRQVLQSWEYCDADGTRLGQKVTPVERVGLYVPGGKAAYPSSVLMNAVPAKVAGVTSLIMVVPMPDGQANDLVLAAARVAGVDRVFAIGGAQAVAALAYGTQTIPKVDKIVGPGNIYVATAKRMVYGQVGIDMIAGPSEILIVCDGQTDPDWVAMDLFSQAEHDEDAQPILLSPDGGFLDAVQARVEALLPAMERRDIIARSLSRRAAFIRVRDLDDAAEVVNTVAPEHLELSVADPDALLAKIRHAGAVFLGRYTAEAIGDYVAGPNHVLPTSGTARFSSPLGVYDFQKRTSIIACSAQGAVMLGRYAATLARGEGLTAHARSAEYRFSGPNS